MTSYAERALERLDETDPLVVLTRPTSPMRPCSEGIVPLEHRSGRRADAAPATAGRPRLLDLMPQVPRPVWGRDELGTGRRETPTR